MGKLMDQIKKSPGAAATATRAKKISKSNKRASTRRRRDQEAERGSYTVYSGTALIGHIKKTGRRFVSFAEPGSRRLGAFSDMKTAFRAVSVAHGVSAHA
jgi:hypothetical protein